MNTMQRHILPAGTTIHHCRSTTQAKDKRHSALQG